MDLAPLNLGMIASYYYITYTTIELFANSLTPKTKVKGLLEIVAAASEFDSLPLRPGEENVVQKMLSHAPVAVDKPRYSDPHTKVNALLQVGVGGDVVCTDHTAEAQHVVSNLAWHFHFTAKHCYSEDQE